MESNDNGALSEVQIRKPHSATGTSWQKNASGKFKKVMTSGKKRGLWLTIG
jgi:hypothetical protein